MSKIKDLLDGMDRWELKRLISQAQKALEAHRPFYIKTAFKRCGKAKCFCKETRGHGPYCYAIYTDRQGCPRQRSLGRRYEPEELDALETAAEPQWFEFALPSFTSSEQDNLCSRSGTVAYKYLASFEYHSHYGIGEEEDTLNRPHRLSYDKARFRAKWEIWADNQKVARSEWASFGIGTKRGIDILNTLVTEGYYLAR